MALLLENGGADASSERLQALQIERQKIRKERQRVLAEIRKENRHRKKIARKVKGLTVDELLSAASRAASGSK